MLEELEHARRRGARIYAELAGYGLSSDANHITQPTIDGPVRAIRMALNEAGMNPEDIDYVNAHGTGTRLNDPTETQVIKAAFGEHARKLAISSDAKSMHGHAKWARPRCWSWPQRCFALQNLGLFRPPRTTPLRTRVRISD